MKNLHLLPTNKSSKLAYYQESTSYNKPVLQLVKTTSSDYKYQNIYITSDEKIKEGDYIFETDTNKVNIADKDYYRNEFDFKIILTTDQDLIKDGVQAIDDEFLEWFVKNPSCEYVEVEPIGYSSGYNLDIPKEEHKQEKACTQDIVNEAMKIVSKDVRQPKCVRDGLVKQETLEEAVNKYTEFLPNLPYKLAVKQAFKEGAKWQSQRMYSEEDMRKCWNTAYIDALSMDEETYKPLFFEDFIEQFKKK